MSDPRYLEEEVIYMRECCSKTRTETIQSCLKQVSDKWAARCARAELRVAQLNSTIRRMKAARKRERAKRSRHS
jgi:hypothetical protein